MLSMLLALATAAQAAPVLPTPAATVSSAPKTVPRAAAANPAVAAQIRELERRWGDAFIKRDFAFIERIIAPEYRLSVGFPDGRSSTTYRDEWMRNSRIFETQGFVANVIDVATAGDTAVALVEGLWTVKRAPDRPATANRFLVTDTWVRRNGRWQVIYRYSHRLPQATTPLSVR